MVKSLGYWFAVAQEVPSITGGSGTAKADETGQGEGAFKDVPSAKVRPITMRDAISTPENEQENANKNANTAGQGIYSDNLRGQTTD